MTERERNRQRSSLIRHIQTGAKRQRRPLSN